MLEQARTSSVEFFLNNTLVQAKAEETNDSLLDYLHSPSVCLTGTKAACREGGCGSCTVLLTKKSAITNKLETRPVNACLLPLNSLDGVAINTIESINQQYSESKSCKSIQACIVENNATQCGYCTPGFVMTMYGMLQKHPTATPEKAEDFFAGNLCRCTGYADLLKVAREAFQGPSPDSLILPILKEPQERCFETNTYTWHRPVTVEALLSRLAELKDQGKPFRLVHGNTSTGVYKNIDEHTAVFVDISQVASLQACKTLSDGILIGAGATLTQFIEHCANLLGTLAPEYTNYARVKVLHDHLRKIGGEQIRNMATVGGSIALLLQAAHSRDLKRPFGSDLVTISLCLSAQVTTYDSQLLTPVVQPLDELINGPNVPFLITHLFIPLTEKPEIAASFHIARRAQNASSLVNAAFSLQLDDARVEVTNASLVFGALSKLPLRALKTEELLQTTPLNQLTGDLLGDRLHQDLASIEVLGFDPDASRSYKEHLCASLLYKFWLHVSKQLGLVLSPNEQLGALNLERKLSNQSELEIEALYSLPLAQHLKSIRSDFAPNKILIDASALKNESSINSDNLVNDNKETIRLIEAQDQPQIPRPLHKISSLIQAKGEAVYTYDQPGPVGTLHAYYIYSTCPSGTFEYPQGLDSFRRRVLQEKGVVGYIAYDNIPANAGGANKLKENLFFGNDLSIDPKLYTVRQGKYDPVFAEYDESKQRGYVSCAGQPIGLIVANNFLTARAIANRYNKELIFTPGDGQEIEKAEFEIEALSFKDLKSVERLLKKSIPKNYSLFKRLATPEEEGWLKANVQILSDQKSTSRPTESSIEIIGAQVTGPQSHFYMEPQVSLATLGEEGSITVFSSSQALTPVQTMVASTLDIPHNQVTAKVTRVGGGFGGKELRQRFYSQAAAVAAHTLKRPVKLALDRYLDMLMTGTRHPMLGRYRVQATKDGRITRWRMEYYSNGGISFDCSLPIMDLVLLDAEGSYQIDNFWAYGETFRTNLASRTAFRSFGLIQGSLIREEAIEHLAWELNMSTDEIREKNFYSDATAGSCPVTPYNQKLYDCRIQDVWQQVKEKIKYTDRKESVIEFNRANRWKKRGISMIPIKYGISYTDRSANFATAHIAVYSRDGSVILQHGGIEMGQGLDTKIVALAADEMGLHVWDGKQGVNFRIGASDTSIIANPRSSGASTTTDLNGGAIVQACRALRMRLEEFLIEPEKFDSLADSWKEMSSLSFLRKHANRKYKISENPSIPEFVTTEDKDFLKEWEREWQENWINLITVASRARVSLSTEGFFKSPQFGVIDDNTHQLADPESRIFYYFTYSVAASEVEIDVLTGEFNILRSDVVYDAGMSLNPNIDYGQVKGGFVQGIGNVTTEYFHYDSNGMPETISTWNYKIPCSKTIPQEFNVYLLHYKPTTDQQKAPLERYGVQSSKSTGEPPLVLATSVFFAIKQAIASARQDIGLTSWFALPSPATVPLIYAYANGLENRV